MRIKKVLNNNFVIVGDYSDKILMGIGIGYKKKINDIIDESLIEKVFSLTDSELSMKFIELLSTVSVDVVHIVDEIVSLSKTHKLPDLGDGVYLSLIDHIQSAIQLFKSGKSISNALLWDIKHLYSEEFKIGEQAVIRINEIFKVDLPVDEAGYIALHLVNSSLEESNSAYETTKLIKSILTIIRYHFGIELDETSYSYSRLVTHLRFFSKRVMSKDDKTGITHKSLYENTRNELKNTYECTLTIKGFIDKQYDYDMSKDEMLYLMIHIERAIKD